MNFHYPAGRLVVLGACVLLLSIAAYQPGYFGDELFPLYIAKTSHSFGEVFLRVNDYKPRLVFNAIWAVLAWDRAPRYVAAIITGLAMFWAAWAAQAVAERFMGASRQTALIVGLCVVISRFGTVFYFDYLSGIIGTMGLAMFLSMVLAIAPVLLGGRITFRRSLAFVAIALATIFVYEMYIGALFVVGMTLALVGFFDRRRESLDRRLLVSIGVAAWLLPLILFALATHFMSTRGVMTGTAGKPVALGLDTVSAFMAFVSNTFFGTNFGLPWFTGFFNASTPDGFKVSVVFAVVLVVLWIWAIVSGHRLASRGRIITSGTVSLVALATIGIASLPGSSLSDARWMFPLSAFVPLLIVSLPRTMPRQALLYALLGVSVFHLVVRSNAGIYNVDASRLSGKVTRALTSLRPVGTAGILLGLPERHVDWILGGDSLQGNDVTSGDVYCWANLAPSPCVDPQSALRRRPISSYDFALAFAEGVANPDTFFLIPRSAVHLLIDPDASDVAGARDLGGTARGWSGWTWRGPLPPGDEDRPMTTTRFGTVLVEGSELAGHVIAYEAYADKAGAGRSMRLQVNWLDRKKNLIYAQIKLVKLTESPQVFTMLLDRPKGARLGEIYATMHEDGDGSARIRSVKLLRL